MLESKLRLNDLSLALYQTQINPTNICSNFRRTFYLAKLYFASDNDSFILSAIKNRFFSWADHQLTKLRERDGNRNY